MRKMVIGGLLSFLAFVALGDPEWPPLSKVVEGHSLPGTEFLQAGGDLSLTMIEGVDRFLDGELQKAVEEPEKASAQELSRILGLIRDRNPKDNGFEPAGPKWGPIGQGRNYEVRDVRWKSAGGIQAEGLLFEPKNGRPLVDVIALPDADQDPEELGAIEPYRNTHQTHPFAAEMALAGCRVLVPALVRRSEYQGMPMREWLHRVSWELGRTLAGYEVHKVLAAIDCFKGRSPGRTGESTSGKVIVAGWGEGGRLALYASALDQRIDGALVSGYFGPRGQVWDEPADRTVFGLLRAHSDAAIAGLIHPRSLIIETGHFPRYGFRLNETGEPQRLRQGSAKRGKPGKLLEHSYEDVRAEVGRMQKGVAEVYQVERAGIRKNWMRLLKKTGVEVQAVDGEETESGWVAILPSRDTTQIMSRQERIVRSIERHNQGALVDSEGVREGFFKEVQRGNVTEYKESISGLRDYFSKQVIGEFATLQELVPPNARTRAHEEGSKTISYEVLLEVKGEVKAYGILTLPKDMRRDGSEKRPVVVCQHGLEGRPQSTTGKKDHHYYKAFATRLAERGFVTFAPQNLYLGWDLFRILQFKANAVGCTLFSVMVPQHRQITNWLSSLPFVDGERIGFYGLSYGGKSAMRIPPLVDQYCLSICSADFNEWVWKNAATDQLSARYTYANKGEYEIFEFDLGGTFNYFEMAALICPRPFMVERGHFDGVAPDKTVAYEFAKVRSLYAAQLGIGSRAEIEWFVGPHTINGDKTYAFLHRHLQWPVPPAE